MLTVIFTILLLCVFAKILGFAIRAAWGLSKIIVSVVLLPLVLIVLVIKGLMVIALPALVVIGLLALLGLHD